MTRAALLAATALFAVLAGGCGGGGFAPAAGDCLRLGAEGAGADGLAEATVVACDEPHDLEVFHVFDLEPDQVEGDALVEAVREACLGDAFTDHVGIPADRSPLELLPLPPTEDQLARGDREVVCTLREPGGGRRTSPVSEEAVEVEAAAAVAPGRGEGSVRDEAAVGDA